MMTSALIQGTEEWLEFRKDKVGASDAPVIMGVSPWEINTPYKLFLVKYGLLKIKENSAMRRGKELESRARDIFTEITGIEMKPDVLIHQTRDWMIASLDGIDSKGKTIVEIKCPSNEDHSFAEINKRVPEKYYPQLQHQIEVCGVDRAYYFSYLNEDETVLLEISRNDAYIKDMLEKEENFYECLKNFIAPELTSKDLVCKDSEEWKSVASEWLEVCDLLEPYKELIKKEEDLRKVLIQLSDGQSCEGFGVKTLKIARKGNVDYGKIEALKGMDLEPYRKSPTEYYKISRV